MQNMSLFASTNVTTLVYLLQFILNDLHMYFETKSFKFKFVPISGDLVFQTITDLSREISRNMRNNNKLKIRPLLQMCIRILEK